jgi:long-chain acyl-CoA synthetase
MKNELKERYPGNTVVDSFWNQVERLRDNVCVMYRKDGKYTKLSYREMGEMVEAMGAYLLENGIRKGDRVGIFAFNRYEWWIADLASLSIGASTVPIYATNSEEEAFFILKDAECKVCFCGDKDHTKVVQNIQKRQKTLKTIISFDSTRGVTSFSKAVADGKKSSKLKLFKKKRDEVEEDLLASIIYTSGTTGDPKGVMILHKNFRYNVLQLADVFGDKIGVGDVFLSFLPLSHALERTAGYYTPITFGSSVAFCENFQTIQADMQEIRPTVIVSVPRLYEKIHSGIRAKLRTYPFIKKFFINRAFKTGIKNIPYICSDSKPALPFSRKIANAEKSVFSKLKKALGMDRLKVAISGGSALAYSDHEFFLSIGISLYEGYGLTECSPVTNVNRVGKIKPGSVGQPLIDTEVKIADNGEILIHGPQVMAGYYNREKESKEAFTKEGFYKSGDIGIIDDQGFLTITGRLKDIIVTAAGKNISPQNIESKLKQSPYVEHVAVIGDKKKFVSAIVSVNHEEIINYAKQHHIHYTSISDLVDNPKIYLLFEDELARLMGNFARVEQVKRFKLVSDTWSQGSGELTPTLKIKRRVIDEKYSDVIEEIYSD